ncbi:MULTISPECIES: hypothetical protein [Hyphomicrobiales]|uniref:hypothetical protein n=1 Tax=Hyphomicrobiales TaxID=356 RepID=UPI00036955E6|nr:MULTISPECIES: hypothetical protein [Phyllobacteriaceae]MCX8568364.1 hypothetical protein [Aminobacter sp. MET-1]
MPTLVIAALQPDAFSGDQTAAGHTAGDHAHASEHGESGSFELTSLILPSAGLAALLAIGIWLF